MSNICCYRGRVVVQHNWDEILRQRGSKVSVSYKKPNEPVKRGLLKHFANDVNDGEILGDGSFEATLLSERLLQLSYKDESNSANVKFLAAKKVFSKIHKPNKIINSLDVTKGGIGVSCDGDDNLFVWMTDTGDVSRHLKGHKGEVYCCRFLPSDLLVLTASADMSLKVWDARNASCLSTFVGHTRGVTDFAIFENGEKVASISKDGTMKIWDCGSSKCSDSFEFPESGILNGCHLVSSSEGTSPQRVLYIATEMKELMAVGLDDGCKLFTYSCGSPVNCCSSLMENKIIFGTRDSDILVLDIRDTSQPLIHIKESRSSILSLLPLNGGCYLTTSDGSGFYIDDQFNTTIDLTGPEYGPLEKIVSDDKNLYTGGKDGTIRCYEIYTN